MKVALNMIVSGNEKPETLQTCLNSVNKYVDGIFVTITSKTDKALKTAIKRYGANIDYEPDKFFYTIKKSDVKFLKDFLGTKPKAKTGDKVFCFDKARNHAMAQVPKEFGWILWLDSDDILRGGENLKGVVKTAEEQNIDACYLNYIYQAEIKDGKIQNVLIEHLRERVIRNNGVYEWVAPIHETLIEKKPTKKVDFEDIDVLHLSNEERRDNALFRNIKSLEYSIASTKGADPRPTYYLGKAYFDIWLKEKDREALLTAKNLFLKYLDGTPEYNAQNKSGWAEERSQCFEYLMEVFRNLKQYDNAIKAGLSALSEDERFPSIYINMALTYLMMKQWGRALFWVKLAGKIPQPKTTLIKQPKDLALRAMEVVYHSALNTSELDKAWAAAIKQLELNPNEEEFQNRVKFIENLKTQSKMTREFIKLVNFLRKTGQNDKVLSLVRAIPREIADNPIMTNLRKEFLPPEKWANDTVVFYCGPGFSTWSPKSLERQNDNEFIGGSEEAVIYLSKELSKLGLKVTVYADPGAEEGKHDGVNWLPYFKFNADDEFNVLVSWRMPDFFKQKVKAKKKYIWCHDVLNPLNFTNDVLGEINKAIVLSKAHRETAPVIPEEQILYSTNGYFEHHPEIKPKNNPKWCIWTSSYDRGLENLLDMWPDVIKEIPDAKLHIFYGWKLFKKFYADNPERMDWMARVEKKMNQKGITHHGRVSQPELEKWIKKCGIWTYPTDFYEINCISAIKAQLWGAVPVTMDYAALSETVQHGVKIKGDIYDFETKNEYKKELIKALKDPKWQKEQRKKMAKYAKDKYSWSKVAKEWSEEFETDELKKAMDVILKNCSSADKFMPVQLQEAYEIDPSY